MRTFEVGIFGNLRIGCHLIRFGFLLSQFNSELILESKYILNSVNREWVPIFRLLSQFTVYQTIHSIQSSLIHILHGSFALEFPASL